MTPEIPAKLYKYKSYTPQSLENLKNHQIYFSSPTNFNDPFDCALSLEFEVLTEESVKWHLHLLRDKIDLEKFKKLSQEYNDEDLFGIYKELPPTAQKSTQEMIIRIANENIEILKKEINEDRGICCLSEKFDDILMWSQYSDSHKGFCIEFDTSKDDIFEKVLCVDYKDDLPILRHAKDKTISENMLENFRTVISTKFSCWEYEKEWRLPHLNKGTLYGVTMECITGIYFGVNMEDKNKEKIYLLLKKINNSVSFYEMIKDEKTFSLNTTKFKN